MANCCEYEMRISGPGRGTALGLARKLNTLGRVYTVEFSDEWERSGEIVVFGDCAWSLGVAFHFHPKIRAGQESAFLAAVAEAGATLEAYSSETDCGFNEHLLIKDGDIVVYEEADYRAFYDDDYLDDGYTAEDVEALIKKLAAEHGVSEGRLQQLTEEGFASIGGFEWEFAGGEAAPLDGFEKRRLI